MKTWTDTITDDEDRTLCARYASMCSDREPYLTRGRDCAALTDQAVLPREGSNGSTKFRNNYQSAGAENVSSLTSKVVNSVYPPGSPFFLFGFNEKVINAANARVLAAREAGNQQAEQMAAAQNQQMQENLAGLERAVEKAIQASPLRTKLTTLCEQLIVLGNSLLYVQDEKNMRVYRLDSYVVSLDPMGNLLELIIKEKVSALTLDEETLAACSVETTKGNMVEVYTGVKLRPGGKMFDTYQEINKLIVPGSEGSYPKERVPYLPVRFRPVEGESYGRGWVEKYIDDLRSLEGLSKSMIQGSAAAARVLFLVSGATDKRALVRANNGDFIEGNIKDVGVLQLGKFADFQITQLQAQKLESRLARAFLATTSIQRSGERVTATEIRALATELETNLGGIYSMLAESLQRPLINVLIAQMQKSGTIPKLDDDLLDITITTGLDALGRGAEAEKLMQFKVAISDIPGAAQAINMQEWVSRFAVSLGVSPEGLIKTDAQLAQEARQARAAEVAQQTAAQVAPDLVRAGVQQGMQQGQEVPGEQSPVEPTQPQ